MVNGFNGLRYEPTVGLPNLRLPLPHILAQCRTALAPFTTTLIPVMLTYNESSLRLALFSPEGIQPDDMNDLAFVEKDNISGASCELMRIIDPPLFLDGSVRSVLTANFHIIGHICQDNYTFDVKPQNGGTQTSVGFSIEPCLGAPARIQWERQVKRLAQVVRKSSKVITHHIRMQSLITSEAEPYRRKIRVVDVESRINEVSVWRPETSKYLIAAQLSDSKGPGTPYVLQRAPYSPCPMVPRCHLAAQSALSSQ